MKYVRYLPVQIIVGIALDTLQLQLFRHLIQRRADNIAGVSKGSAIPGLCKGEVTPTGIDLV